MKETIEVGSFQEYPDVLTVKDLCHVLRIGRVGAYKLLTSGAIQSFKIGKTYKIPKDSLIAYVNRACVMEQEKEEQK